MILRLRNFFYIFAIVTILSLLVNPAVSFSQAVSDLSKLKADKPIIVNGDKVEFFESDGLIVASGDVSITYGDVTLSCDYIEVNTKTKQAKCQGNVLIVQEEGTLSGDLIQYDFINKKGEIIGGELDAFPWFAQAEETSRVGSNEYLFKEGFVTTCDLDEPHYRIVAKEIRVFPDEKIIARNVVIYIGNVPVMCMPYYYQPIIESRAKVQFIPGWNTDWGYFLLSAWRFYIRGNSKMDVLLDYRTQKGFAEGADIYYNASDFGLNGLGEGLFRMYFIHQNGFGTYYKEAFRDGNDDYELRKRFQLKHRIDFDPGTVGMLEFNKMSDEYVLKDYYYNEYEENNRVPNNYVSVVSVKPNYTFRLEANKRFHDFYTVTQKLPELKLEVPDQRLWETPLYYSTEVTATRFEKEFAFEKSPPEQHNRLDFYSKLTYVAQLGPLNITPFVDIRETFYDESRWRYGAFARTALGGGLNVESRFYRIYDVYSDTYGLEINRLRHIIVPRAEYTFLFQPTVDKNNIYQMDYIDALEKSNQVTFSLENKLQTKRKSGDEMKTVDLVRTIMSVDFLFRMKKDQFEFKKTGQFRNLKLDVEVKPYDWWYLDTHVNITPKNQAMNTVTVESVFQPWESFKTAFGYRYEKLPDDPRNQITFDMHYRINPKWKIGLYERFDVENGGIEEQQITIVRDLHCWEVELSYNIEGTNFLKDDSTFWLAFKIKAFPDLPIGLDRSFTKRPPGAIAE